ncbi:ankyrin [Wilcoxina mikolae CBS 423.85]|nr:ankyrin [Wilcoxina mikolae CBS 423.85]
MPPSFDVGSQSAGVANTIPPSHLEKLPVELLHSVADYCTTDTLSSLTRSSRFLHVVLNRHLYSRASHHRNAIYFGDIVWRYSSLSCSHSLVTPLHWAAYNGNHYAIEKLLEIDCFDINSCSVSDEENWEPWSGTPLHFAVLGAHPETARFLLENGATVNAYAMFSPKVPGNTNNPNLFPRRDDVLRRYDIAQITPLYVAVGLRRADIVDILLEYKPDMSPIPVGPPGVVHGFAEVVSQPPLLHLAVGLSGENDTERVRIAITESLLRSGYPVNPPIPSPEADLCETALMELVSNPFTTHTLAALLLRYGANVNATNYYGDTALHIAIQMNRVKYVQQLVAAGADVNAEGNSGLIPLGLALDAPIYHDPVERGEKLAMVRILLDAGTDVHHRNFRNHGSALHLVGSKKLGDIIKWASSKEVSAKYIARGGRPFKGLTKSSGRNWNSSLYWVIPLVRLLVRAGVDLNTRDHDGRRALSIGDYHLNKQEVKILSGIWKENVATGR